MACLGNQIIPTTIWSSNTTSTTTQSPKQMLLRGGGGIAIKNSSSYSMKSSNFYGHSIPLSSFSSMKKKRNSVIVVNKGGSVPPAKDQDGKNVKSLSKFKGKPLVLYFYPADHETPGCTKQTLRFKEQRRRKEMLSDNNNKNNIMSSEVDKEDEEEEEEEEEEIRRRKAEEEALEVKSLRRIISAYLNYPEAAEEDVRRYEKSFRKLPLSHKALLAHLPLKYQKMRWCISENTHFIFEMLNAFEPPVDFSQDDGNHEHPDNGSYGHHHSEDRDPCCESATISGRAHSTKSGEACCGHEEKNGSCCEPESGNIPEDLECKTDDHKSGCDSATDAQDQGLSNSANNSHKDISSVPPESSDMLEPMPHFHVPQADVDKVRWVIRNIVRDWAVEGQKERDQCYMPILEELKHLFPDRCEESPPTCLVPGAGLGRLALEISCLGFASQGNEFSYDMTICSSFILNQTQAVGEWTIYPWIHSNCNSLADADQLRPVSIPDIHPAGAGITEGFSMCGGDFVEVYSEPCQVGAWDAVVTCFFLDTAHNIVEYIEIISRILKDGGVWINLGPLLYHFSDMYGQDDEMSIELSLEDVKRVAIHYGFQFEVEKTIETTYSTNPRAMMQNRYYSAFWTMRKKPSAITSIQQDMDE